MPDLRLAATWVGLAPVLLTLRRESNIMRSMMSTGKDNPLASKFVAFAPNEAEGHAGSLPDPPTLNRRLR